MTAARILIVEDELIIAQGIERQLRLLEYDVTGLASTGEQALQLAEQTRPDLVLMDIQLGSAMDGITAADLIRQRYNLPVVFLTAHSDESTLRRARATKPFGYIVKPFEEKDLHTSIEIGLERHRTEQRVRESEEWLAATLDSIGEGVLATDQAARVRLLNPVAEQVLGWTQAEAFERDLHEIFCLLDEKTRQPRVNPAIAALQRGGRVPVAANTLLLSRQGKEYPIEASAAPVRDANQAIVGAVLVFRDISERRRLEAELRQIQKLEALGRLAGGIAHNFNNILTIIIGFSELLLRNDLPLTDQHSYAKHIHAAARRAALLTEQIMAFSRKQILKPVLLHLSSHIATLVPAIQQHLGDQIQLLTQLTEDPGLVRADPSQLGQVIMQLAANARDALAGQPGGRLVITTAIVTRSVEEAQRHPEIPPGRFVLLTISDNGPGIPPSVLEHLFEPFFTTKGPGKGTGLGLATAHGIIRQSEGFIDVSSAPGQGTSFRVFLPLVEGPGAPPSIRPSQLIQTGQMVLLVEDEDTIRQIARTVLEQNSYTVLEASDGLTAAQLAESHAGTIDLLITDLRLPRLSGQELAMRLAAARPRMRVLFISGYSDDELPPLDPALCDFLAKPFNLAALRDKVRGLLHRPLPLGL
ncbi:MAG: response regulator [Gemmataceae bacterium]